MLRNGHAVAADEADLRQLAVAAGVEVRRTPHPRAHRSTGMKTDKSLTLDELKVLHQQFERELAELLAGQFERFFERTEARVVSMRADGVRSVRARVFLSLP